MNADLNNRKYEDDDTTRGLDTHGMLSRQDQVPPLFISFYSSLLFTLAHSCPNLVR
jgi:hypothetical protein